MHDEAGWYLLPRSALPRSSSGDVRRSSESPDGGALARPRTVESGSSEVKRGSLRSPHATRVPLRCGPRGRSHEGLPSTGCSHHPCLHLPSTGEGRAHVALADVLLVGNGREFLVEQATVLHPARLVWCGIRQDQMLIMGPCDGSE